MAPALDLSALISSLEEEDPYCPAPPSAASGWSETRVRAWFTSGGEDKGEVEPDCSPAAPGLTREEVRAREQTLRLPSSRATPASRSCPPQLLRKYPPPSAETFLKWFPGLERRAGPASSLVCSPHLGRAGARRAAPPPACA